MDFHPFYLSPSFSLPLLPLFLSVSSALSEEQVKDLKEKLSETIQSVNSALSKEQTKELQEKLSEISQSVSSALFKKEVKSLKEKLRKTIQFVSSTLSEEQVKDLKEKLSKNIEDITEYGRAVHAEMEALLSATRTGVTVRGGTLYIVRTENKFINLKQLPIK